MATGLLLAATMTGCVRPIAPRLPSSTGAREALLVLPGFGYGRAGERVLRKVGEQMAEEGLDLYVPTYVRRAGLDDSRSALREFLAEHRLERYERTHVFAFIAGAWTLNPLLGEGALDNLQSVVYDRSPYQERAPRIADDKLHFVTWLRYGSPVFELARSPYPPLEEEAVRVALLIETQPTPFIEFFEKTARSYGPYQFGCDSFGQRFDDCAYLALDHEEMYERFDEVWPEVLRFIRVGRFGPQADRTPPTAERDEP